jgi:hypothetical protein
MNPLERLDPEELVKLSDVDFQETVKLRAKALAATAMDTIEDVMNDIDDSQARMVAANKILDLAGAKDSAKSLPFGITEEVFRIALAGLGQLSSIARSSNNEMLLRDVTPAKADPRPLKRLAEGTALTTPRAASADETQHNSNAIDLSDLPEGMQLEDMHEE